MGELHASRRHFFLEVFGPIIEGLGYLSTYWRIRGMVSKLGGARAWGGMERKGSRPVGAGPA